MRGGRDFEQGLRERIRRATSSEAALDRRRFIMGAAALGAAGLLPETRAKAAVDALPPITSFPDKWKGKGQVRVASAGGALADAERKAFIEPFRAMSGIEVIEAEGFSTAQIKAQVDTKSVQWDVVELGRGNILPLAAQGKYFEDIDYAIVDVPGVPQSEKFKESIAFFLLGTVMTYRTDVFSQTPSGWADFWDLKRFPGPRNWMSGSMGIAPQLEGALIADGVPMDKLYPLDIPRALKSLSKIKTSISTFWNSGAQSAQLMADKETLLGTAWNGRIAPLVEKKLPVAISWSGARFEREHFVALAGTPNRENAMKYIAFACSPEAQARFSMLIPYGYTNKDAAALVPVERQALLPSAHLAEGFACDDEWWGKNNAAAIEAWADWLLN
jgi:putative spermidine/putrescine transport system substrate-binding protein